MRIVYLDEARTSKPEPVALVAGAIVHGDHQLSRLQQALRTISHRHLPEADRDTEVLHATDIYGGNRYFNTSRKPDWKVERRMVILRDLASIPAELNLRVTLGQVNKAQTARVPMLSRGACPRLVRSPAPRPLDERLRVNPARTDCSAPPASGPWPA